MFPIVLIRNNCRWASYWELAVLQPFGEQAQAGAVPEDQRHSVGSLARKQKITRENGSACNCSFTSAASPSIPLRLCGAPHNRNYAERTIMLSAGRLAEYPRCS